MGVDGCQSNEEDSAHLLTRLPPLKVKNKHKPESLLNVSHIAHREFTLTDVNLLTVCRVGVVLIVVNTEGSCSDTTDHQCPPQSDSSQSVGSHLTYV